MATFSNLNIFGVEQAININNPQQSDLPDPPVKYKTTQKSSQLSMILECYVNRIKCLAKNENNTNSQKTDSMHLIPLKLVFTYKFDEAEYLK